MQIVYTICQLSKVTLNCLNAWQEKACFTYVIKASHSKKFSSLTGPATIPSGGFNVSSVKQNKHWQYVQKYNFRTIHGLGG